MKDSLRIKKLRNRLIILGAVVVFLIAGYYFVYAKVSAMKESTATIESDTIVLQGQADNAASLKLQYDQQSAERSKIESFIVKKDGEADFIGVIEALAGQAGLQYEIQSVDFAPSGSSAADLQNLELKVSVSGSFKNIYQFQQLVENMPYSINIASIDLTSTGQSGNSTSTAAWQGNFDILVAAFK